MCVACGVIQSSLAFSVLLSVSICRSLIPRAEYGLDFCGVWCVLWWVVCVVCGEAYIWCVVCSLVYVGCVASCAYCVAFFVRFVLWMIMPEKRSWFMFAS